MPTFVVGYRPQGIAYQEGNKTFLPPQKNGKFSWFKKNHGKFKATGIKDHKTHELSPANKAAMPRGLR